MSPGKCGVAAAHGAHLSHGPTDLASPDPFLTDSPLPGGLPDEEFIRFVFRL